MKAPTDDRIRIEQLEISARIGVSDEERSSPQRIAVSVSAWPATDFEQVRDEIECTINYVNISRDVRKFAESRGCKLIETLASDLASHLLARFPMKAVEVEVRKFVLPDTQFVSATVLRKVSS